MADLNIANRRSEQPRAWAAAMLACAATLLIGGCGPSPDEIINGTWAVDADAWLADPSLQHLSADARGSLVGIGSALVRQTTFEFQPGRCTRRVADRVEETACTVDRTTRSGQIVLRAEGVDGGSHFIRIRVTDRGLRVSWRERTLPVIAVNPSVSRPVDSKMTKRAHGILDSPVPPN